MLPWCCPSVPPLRGGGGDFRNPIPDTVGAPCLQCSYPWNLQDASPWNPDADPCRVCPRGTSRHVTPRSMGSPSCFLDGPFQAIWNNHRSSKLQLWFRQGCWHWCRSKPAPVHYPNAGAYGFGSRCDPSTSQPVCWAYLAPARLQEAGHRWQAPDRPSGLSRLQAVAAHQG